MFANTANTNNFCDKFHRCQKTVPLIYMYLPQDHQYMSIYLDDEEF